MERKLTVILVEDDPFESQAIVNCAEDMEDIRLLSVTNNVEKALNDVKDYRPDAVILDLELHRGYGNGLEFLEGASKSVDYKPFVLVTTSNTSAMTHKQARELGADFIMSKSQGDYSARKALNFLLSMKNILHSNTVNKTATTETPAEKSNRVINRAFAAIERVGISPKVIGKNYLADAICTAIESPQANIVAEVARKYRKTDASIIRAMQTAISNAWRSMDIEVLKKNYTAYINPAKGSPTVMEFIYYYADKIGKEY